MDTPWVGIADSTTTVIHGWEAFAYPHRSPSCHLRFRCGRFSEPWAGGGEKGYMQSVVAATLFPKTNYVFQTDLNTTDLAGDAANGRNTYGVNQYLIHQYSDRVAAGLRYSGTLPMATTDVASSQPDSRHELPSERQLGIPTEFAGTGMLTLKKLPSASTLSDLLGKLICARGIAERFSPTFSIAISTDKEIRITQVSI